MALLLWACVGTAAQPLQVGSTSAGSLSLDPYMEVWEDGGSNAAAAEVNALWGKGAFQPLAEHADLHLPGPTLTSYWVTFAVSNGSAVQVKRMLEVPLPDTDYVDVYRANDAAGAELVASTGSAMAFSQRSYSNRRPVVEITVAPKETARYFVRISTGNWVNVHLMLWDQPTFQWHERVCYNLQFALLGLYLAVFLGCLYFYALLRQIGYLYFGAHALSLAAFNAFHEGLAKQYLLPDAGDVQRLGYTVAFGLAVVTGVQFLLYFFRIHRAHPRVARLAPALSWLIMAALMWNTLMPGKVASITPILASLVVVALLVVPLLKAAPKVVAGNIVMASLGILLLGIVLDVVTRSSTLANQLLIANVFPIMGGIYLFGNTVAVATRIRFIVKTNEELHATTLAMQREAVDALIGKEQRLEKQIESRTSDLKEATDQLARTVAQAERANVLRSNFLAVMSHEIRTPLNAVLGMNHLASHYSMDRRARQYIEKSMAAADTLLTLVNEIFDLPAIETGGMILRVQSFNVTELLENIRNTLGTTASHKGLAFHVNGDVTLPERVLGDPDRISQVLINLLGNALKFTEHGGVSLVASTEAREPSAVLLRFTIQDTGIGMTNSQMAQLFERFAQADASIGRRFGGTGLGLVIAKNLLERMGGTIQVNSQAGKGTRFDILLRLGLPVDADTANEHSATLPTPSDFMGLKGDEVAAWAGIHVLLVEDNAWNREYAQGLLATLGIITHVAENGQRALEQLQANERIRLVLMDCHMPVMDGFTAAQNIRAREAYAQLPIIALTADVVGDVRRRVLAAGMNDIMFKPFTAHDLTRMLQRWSPSQQATTGKGENREGSGR